MEDPSINTKFENNINFRNQIIGLVITDVFTLLGISYKIGMIFYGIYFIVSPLVAILFVWFFIKPIRIFRLSKSKLTMLLRAVLMLSLGISVLLYGIPSMFEATLYQGETLKDILQKGALFTLIEMILSTLLYLIVLLEFIGGLMFLLKFGWRLENFDMDFKLAFGEALLFASGFALLLSSVFSGLIYVGYLFGLIII